MDVDYINSLIRGPLQELSDHYFRAEIIKIEKIPDSGPAILASNHSGNAFPHDGIILNTLLWRQANKDGNSYVRTMFSPKLAKVWWMRAFTIDDFWRKCGAVDQTFTNFDRLLKNRDRLLYYPEGVPGIGKGFNRRYQLQYFHTSFVILAARHDVPVIPVYTVNAEWVNPGNYTFKPLDRLFDFLFGIPFFPVPNVFLAVLFPFIFYLSFPCRIYYKVEDPINIRELVKQEGGEDPANPDRQTANRVAANVRRQMQKGLEKAVAEYGKNPYDLPSLKKELSENKGKRKRIIPSGWPISFLRHYRDLYREKARNRLHAFFRDLDLIFFYIPLGWIGISLCRRLRKPPYGLRGLNTKAKKLQQGAYSWSLKDNPLPAKQNEASPELRPLPKGK